MKVSINTRPYKTGYRMGKSIVATAQLLYFDKNFLNYLTGIIDAIQDSVHKRMLNGGMFHTNKTRPSRKTSTNKGMRTPK